MNAIRSGATYLHWQCESTRLLERPGPRTQHLNAEVNWNTQATMRTHLWHPLLLHFITMRTGMHRGNSSTHCCYILLQCQLEHPGNNVYTHLWYPLLLHFITMPTGTYRGNSGTHCCYNLLQCQLEHTGNTVDTAVSHTPVTFYYNAHCFCCKRSCTCTRTHIHRHVSQAEPGPKDFLPALQN